MPRFQRPATLSGRISVARTALRFGRNQKSVGYRQISRLLRLAAVVRRRLPRTIRHEITFEYQSFIDVVELLLRTRYAGHQRRKFGRIYQRFWIRSPPRFVARAIR